MNSTMIKVKMEVLQRSRGVHSWSLRELQDQEAGDLHSVKDAVKGFRCLHEGGELLRVLLTCTRTRENS